ncbi:polysaccharide ABC transporter ATP-binding protein [Flavobacterium sp.]|uniref:ABC transporter ATP-binding protein n=1 Tax=Flavobacterium sp. TaxID=239 RepID=UPI0038FC8DA9
MSKPVIKVENLSKAYQIGQIGTGTISRDLERFVTTKILGKEDPFLKIGETNDRGTKGSSDIVWSLKDLNFEINQGDAVGIIGKNGAGKSTLLKLLSRVTSPTTGNIKVKGRIASLLEVGTGFHPELSGRENIYLNGAILGMRKKEITRKLDEIIDFSGVERYVDTPVKRYSSGMYVRLAFAVAAHLESEILIVDEVLAVGDAEFQKKCLGKMGDISKGEGRTVLFVSHNMASVKLLCNNSILLSNGIMQNMSATDIIINEYKKLYNQNNTSKIFDFKNEYFTLNEISYKNNEGTSFIAINDDIHLNLIFDFKNDISGIAIELFVKNDEEALVFNSFTKTFNVKKGILEVTCIVPKNLLNNALYKLTIGVSKDYISFLAKYEDILEIEVENHIEELGWQGKVEGIIRPKLSWIVNKIAI